MADTVQAFQLGSSTVVTLPKKLGIKPGQKLRIEKDKLKIILKAEKVKKSDIVDKLAGGLKFKKHLTPTQLNKLFEKSYEKLLR